MFINILETRKNFNQTLEKKIYKMHVNLGRVSQIKGGEVLKNEKPGKLEKLCPFVHVHVFK